MNFNDPLTYALLSLALVILSAKSLGRWRLQFFTAINIVFVALCLNSSGASLAVFSVFLIIHYFSLRLMLISASSLARSVIFWFWLILCLAGFVVTKQYHWITELVIEGSLVPASLVTVGLSFILFRQLCLAIEARDGALNEVPILEYLNFNLAFWTFIAGPLQRFDAFRVQSAKLAKAESVATQEILLGLNRAAFGFIKMSVLANVASKYATTSTFLDNPHPLFLLVFTLAFPVYLYLNFSGYCDVVIGVARAVGFKLPENFNHPYLARNINDFWSRWHITLSELLRDYLYFPIQTSLARHIPILLAMVFATLFSFLVMGVWHGTSVSFAVFGLLHGIGVVVVNLYTEGLKKALCKEQLKRYRNSRPVRLTSVVVTQCYVILTFLPFNYSSAELSQLFQSICALVGNS